MFRLYGTQEGSRDPGSRYRPPCLATGGLCPWVYGCKVWSGRSRGPGMTLPHPSSPHQGSHVCPRGLPSHPSGPGTVGVGFESFLSFVSPRLGVWTVLVESIEVRVWSRTGWNSGSRRPTSPTRDIFGRRDPPFPLPSLPTLPLLDLSRPSARPPCSSRARPSGRRGRLKHSGRYFFAVTRGKCPLFSSREDYRVLESGGLDYLRPSRGPGGGHRCPGSG